MIAGHGRDGAEIMLVSDWCLREDLVSGEALSGSQEKTLGIFFSAAGYRVQNTYRTSYIKNILDYDGKSKALKHNAIKKAFEDGMVQGVDYGALLKDEILSIRPNIIVPLGDLSLKFLSGYSPLASYRGSVLPLNPYLQQQIPEKSVRVIGTFSPRATWENYTSRVYVQLDYNKIVNLREVQDPIEPHGQIWVCRTVEAFRNYLARHRDIMSRPEKDRFLTVDIETYLGFITAIGFCFDGKEAMSIPIMESKVDYANSLLLWVEIAKILDSGIPKVNQHIRYDWTICERFGFRMRNIRGDTVLGFHLLYPELPKNLGFQTSIYTNLPYFKDESSKKEIAFNPKLYTKDSLYLYNAKDALATWQIHRAQLDEMEEAGVDRLYHEKIVPLITIYKKIDDTGLLVDQSKKNFLLSKYRTLLLSTAMSMQRTLEPLVKFDSPEDVIKTVKSSQKLGHLIYDILKYPPRYQTTEGGKKSFKTNKDTLDDLMILYGETNKLGGDGRRVLSYAITIRKIIKVIEYIKSPLHPDGTLKTNYNLGGTETGRSSASKTTDTLIEFDLKGKLVWPMKKLGRSLQTITKHGFDIDGDLFESVGDERLGQDIRSMFVPRRGYVLAEGDGSQAEARVVAVLAEDYELLKQFDIKPKVHARTAGLIFDMDPNLITKDSPVIPGIGMAYYDMGKRIRHAGNLGMGAFRLAQMTHVDVNQCQFLLNKFHESCPQVRGIFHAEVGQAVKRTAFLRTPWGRQRQFFERVSEHNLKEAYAYIPQSTISDLMKFALIPLTEKMPWANWVYEGHDALMAEIPVGREEEFSDIFRSECEKPINFLGCTLSRDIELSIPNEISIGAESWGQMIELKKGNKHAA